MTDLGLRQIAIIGAGAMGCSLAAITSSHVKTVLVVRNDALRAQISQHGIVLSGELEAAGKPVVAGQIEDLAEIHPIDLVFIATKTTSIAEVCAAMAPHLSELPFLVSYQNGIEPGKTIIVPGETQIIEANIHEQVVSMRAGEIELSAPLGFATFQTSGAIRNVRLRRLPARVKMSGYGK